MKKTLFLFFVAAALSLSTQKAFAQYEKGDKLLNVGLNLGGTYGGGIGLGASFEAGIHEYISVGAQADFVSWNYGWVGSNIRYNFFYVGGRGSYHFGKHFITNEKLDLYAGPSLGFRIANYSYDGIGYNSSYGNGVFFGAFAGAKYYFKPNMAVFAEVGYNASALKAGIAFKF
ncbi:porin family protein [Dyadobacter sp. 32]|uniref:porin family protein n=1 Tax=Dyadobacter sp. 32 TaxID=538966 RepID=UPI0011EF188C